MNQRYSCYRTETYRPPLSYSRQARENQLLLVNCAVLYIDSKSKLEEPCHHNKSLNSGYFTTENHGCILYRWESIAFPYIYRSTVFFGNSVQSNTSNVFEFSMVHGELVDLLTLLIRVSMNLRLLTIERLPCLIRPMELEMIQHIFASIQMNVFYG